MQQPPPPPPPPLPGALTGPPPPMPPQLQDMMRQMQQRQPKFQQARQQGGRGGRNGRGRGGGRGRGRGGFQQNNRQNRGYHNHQSQFKRKRGPSDDVPDASRFFMPSFLEDPWKQLEKNGQGNVGHEHEEKQQHSERRRGEMRPQQVHYPKKDGTGHLEDHGCRSFVYWLTSGEGDKVGTMHSRVQFFADVGKFDTGESKQHGERSAAVDKSRVQVVVCEVHYGLWTRHDLTEMTGARMDGAKAFYHEFN